VRQANRRLRGIVDCVPTSRILQHLSSGAVRVDEFDFPAPSLLGSLSPLSLRHQSLAVDFTAAFGPTGDTLVAARYHSLAHCPLRSLFAGDALAGAAARVTGRTFLLSAAAPEPQGPGDPSAGICRSPLVQISNASSAVPYTIFPTEAGAGGLCTFTDPDGRGFVHHPPSTFVPLPHPIAGEHYAPDREGFWLQARSLTHVAYVIDSASCDTPSARVVVFDTTSGRAITPGPGCDGRLGLCKGKAFVALGPETLVMFPIVTDSEDDTPTLLSFNLRTQARHTVAIPGFLLSAHTRLTCVGGETFIFYCPPETGDAAPLEDADSDSDDSEPEVPCPLQPLLLGRRLTAYRLKDHRVQAALNLRRVYGHFQLPTALLVFGPHSCGLVDLATGIRFAQCVFPADAPLTLGDFGPLHIHLGGPSLQVLLKERAKFWNNRLLRLSIGTQEQVQD